MVTNERALGSLLSSALGASIQVLGAEQITPWPIVRCHLKEGSIVEQNSVILKFLREHPSDRTDPKQLATEAAALSFLTALQLDLAPRLIAADLARQFLVLEDLGSRQTLLDYLRKKPRDAEESVKFVKCLADLHKTTVRRSEQFNERAKSFALDPLDAMLERRRFLEELARDPRSFAESLDVQLPIAAETEIEQLHATLADPGPFLALSNGDSGPNNFMLGDRSGWIIDWEFAGYRHALSDVTWIHVPGSMWVQVNHQTAPELESVYRLLLQETVPEAADDSLFGLGIAAACLGMALHRFHRFPLLDTRPSGDESRVQMVCTLESAALAAQRHGALPNLAEWVRGIAVALRRRWPDADLELSFDEWVPRK